jgi:hypothetical protein
LEQLRTAFATCVELEHWREAVARIQDLGFLFQKLGKFAVATACYQTGKSSTTLGASIQRNMVAILKLFGQKPSKQAPIGWILKEVCSINVMSCQPKPRAPTRTVGRNCSQNGPRSSTDVPNRRCPVHPATTVRR